MEQSRRKRLTQIDKVISEKKRKNDGADCSTNEVATKARAGTISRIVLKNVLCHSHLEVEFTNNINYIIGQNGSGKSAIITALIIGLGGKASLTNRADSLKGIIKEGQNSASVEITLRNAGPFSYSPDLYGDESTILRNFRINGTSSYKIKSTSGQTVSKTVKEVQLICQGFNIQVDNPVCLLTQHTARTFLNTDDTHQKFLLFIRATWLEELQEEYKQIFKNGDEADRLLEEKRAQFDKLEKEYAEILRKIENYKSIQDLQNQLKTLDKELLWAKAHNSERDVNKEQAIVNELEKEKSNIEEKIKDEERQKSAIEQTVQNLHLQISRLKESIEQQNAPQRRIVDLLSELKQSVNEKQREKRSTLKQIAMTTGNCNILEKEITKMTEKTNQIEQEKMKHLEQLSDIENKIKIVEDVLETSENERFQIRNSLNCSKEEGNILLAEIRQIVSQIEMVHSSLESLKSECNPLSVYGRNTPKIVEAINANKSKFKYLPRGPLGSYIKVKDKKWTLAIECFLSSHLLCGFTVDNTKDNKLLVEILNKVCPSAIKPTVITSKFVFETHDVSKNLVIPVDGCISLYDAIEVSDPVVANCLIDQSGLESALLIPDNQTALRLMSDRRVVPKNCHQGITINADKYYPDPNYRTYGNARYLQVSAADKISRLEKKLDDLKHQKVSVVNRHRSFNVQLQEQNQKLQDLELKITKFERAVLVLKNQHDEITSLMGPDSINLQQLVNELNNLKKSVEEKNINNQKLDEELKRLKITIAATEGELESIKTVVHGYEDRIASLNQQIHDHTTKCKGNDINKRFTQNRLVEIRNRLSLARSELLKKQQTMEGCFQQASECGDRPRNLREVSAIVDELNMIKRSIKQIQSDSENPEILIKKSGEYKKKLDEAKELMKIMIKDVNELKIAVEKRSNHYQHTEEFLISLIKFSFQNVLKLRQFQGTIDINMEERKLELIVSPHQGSQGATKTANLSGGERSFSTIAFLYALWECMDFPFYFLDEFDVYMDKVNRSKAMDILLHYAKSNSKLQFVFLTPQSVSFLHDKKDVTVLRLEDPERGITNSN